MVGGEFDMVSPDLDLKGGWPSCHIWPCCHIWPWLEVLSGCLGNGTWLFLWAEEALTPPHVPGPGGGSGVGREDTH